MANTKTTEKLAWSKLNLSTMSAEAQKAFAAAKAAYHVYDKAKTVAESFAIDHAHKVDGLPLTHTLKFGYRFGPEPGVAIVEQEDEKKKASKGAKSMAEIVASNGFVSERTLIKAA